MSNDMPLADQMIQRAIRDDAAMDARHRYRRPLGECSYCDEHRAGNMMPSHTASPNCESGKRNHCTCSVCY